MQCNTNREGVESVANSTAELTDTQVKRAKIKEAEYNLSDGKGLQLRIKPSGSKVWLFNYARPATKKRTNLKLGEYPDLSLAAARKERNRYRTLLAEGVDPQVYEASQAQLESEASANTLKAVADKWFSIKSHDISEAYAADVYNSLANHIFPKLGSVPISELKPKAVIEVLEPLQEKGKLEMVKRVCQRLNMIMDFAVIRGITELNPLSPIGKAFKSPKKVHLPTIKPEHLPELLQAVQNANIKLTTRCLLEWQLHTMVRPGEAAGARWDEIDEEQMIWTIPAGRMKKKRIHVVPLTPQAIQILETMKPISRNREFVFPSNSNPRQHASSAAVNMALKRMGFKGRLVSHGFRALASTTLNEEGFDQDLIEAALAHVDKNSVRAAYNRTDYLERRRAIMHWWSHHIAHQLMS